jgi:hypothetical protein
MPPRMTAAGTAFPCPISAGECTSPERRRRTCPLRHPAIVSLMGLKVSRVLAVGENDAYAWFLYYVPSNALQHGWINDWMAAHFDRVAERIGPDAVLIAPFASRQEAYIKDLAEAINWSRLSEANRQIGWNPALIATRLPLRADAEPEAMIIDLDLVPSERRLAMVLDAVAEQIREGGEITGPVNGRGDGALGVLGFLELKPNIAGVGLNVNAFVESYRRRRGDDRRRRFRWLGRW